MNFRQVHLDFHTGEKIPSIGMRFSKKQFQEALKKGHVNSVTVFSKCYHGWAYHPTKANEMHPNLKFDLLKMQIEAAHEIGVKTPVYISAGVDEKMARRHPEWLVRAQDESTVWTKDFTQPGFHLFCFNSAYLPYLVKQVEEVCETYDADGIFLDSAGVRKCYCQNCINTLLKEGKDPYDENNIAALAERTFANYSKAMRQAVDKFKPGLPIFHNDGHVHQGRRDIVGANSHLELESLPTGGWGYDHFPLSAAYARTLDMPFLGMTAKFHTTWGDFGGFKHPNALRYETALAVANGARCSIGDQMHPSGEMDPVTYEIIGAAYEEIERKEPWLEGAENIADIGIFTVEAAGNYYSNARVLGAQDEDAEATDAGCARILLEGNYLFNAIDASENFSKYKLILLPDRIRLDKALKEKFQTYLDNGGKLLASGRSGLCDDKDEFAIDLGIKYHGRSAYNPSYLRPKIDVSPFAETSFVIRADGYNVEAVSAQELGVLENPYFNRSALAFSSHQHTPPSGEYGGCGIAVHKNTAYIAWDIFAEYGRIGCLISKKVVCSVIDSLLRDKTVETDLPAQGIVTVTRQKERMIVHLLYASPVKRGKNIEVIEDIIPLHHIAVKVKTDGVPNRVYLAPELQEIAFHFENGEVSFVVDRMENHQMIVIE